MGYATSSDPIIWYIYFVTILTVESTVRHFVSNEVN